VGSTTRFLCKYIWRERSILDILPRLGSSGSAAAWAHVPNIRQKRSVGESFILDAWIEVWSGVGFCTLRRFYSLAGADPCPLKLMFLGGRTDIAPTLQITRKLFDGLETSLLTERRYDLRLTNSSGCRLNE